MSRVMVETLARALWELVPWRPYSWDNHPNPDVLDHYRKRAEKLLEQFDIRAKG